MRSLFNTFVRRFDVNRVACANVGTLSGMHMEVRREHRRAKRVRRSFSTKQVSNRVKEIHDLFKLKSIVDTNPPLSKNIITKITCKRPCGGTFDAHVENPLLVKYYNQNGLLDYARYVHNVSYHNLSVITDVDNKSECKYVVRHTGFTVESITGSKNWRPHGEYVEYSGDKIRFYGEYDYNNLVKTHIHVDKTDKDMRIKDGEITVWKVCKTDDGTKVYVELFVPKHSKRKNISNSDDTCIIEHATVKNIFDKHGNTYDKAQNYMHSFHIIDYVVGKSVKAQGYGINGGGIYVFLDKKSCDDYM